MWIHEQRAATMPIMATGGGLVFGGDVNGRFKALDQETGEVLWEINLGSPVVGYPISYAVGGRQYVGGQYRRGRRGEPAPDTRAAPQLGEQSVRVRAAGITNDS